LDLKGINPLTRIITRPGETMEGALERIRAELKADVTKIETKKAKGSKFKPEFELVLDENSPVKEAETVVVEVTNEESKEEGASKHGVHEIHDDFDLSKKDQDM
jgi:hypothetical protein